MARRFPRSRTSHPAIARTRPGTSGLRGLPVSRIVEMVQVTTTVGCCSGQAFVPRAIATSDVFEALTTLVDVSWTWAKWFIVIAISSMSPTDATGG